MSDRRDIIVSLLKKNTAMTDEEIGAKADELIAKGIIGTRDMALLYGTQPRAVSIWARNGRIPGALKPSTQWLFLVDRIPARLRINNSGRGGLPPAVKSAIDADQETPVRELAERYGVSLTYIYKRRKHLNKEGCRLA